MAITIVYSKLMADMVGDKTKYSFSGAGKGTLAIDSVTYTYKEKVENIVILNLSGISGNGLLTLTIDPSVTDSSGNSLENNILTFNVEDPIPPTILTLKVNPQLFIIMKFNFLYSLCVCNMNKAI